MKFKEGEVVVVLGKIDSRVREHVSTGIVKGTVYCILRMEGFEIAVVLESGDIWIGLERELAKVKDQE